MPTPSDPDRALYAISVAAELTGVDPQMLRIYESRGLLETVDGLGSPDEVTERLTAVVDRRSGQSGS